MTAIIMSENVRRSTRLQDKRRKIAAKVKSKRKKSCRILDEDSFSSDDSTDDKLNDSAMSHDSSFTRLQNKMGSRGGNFTTIYSSYNKESSLSNRLDIYEEDFIDDGDDNDDVTDDSSCHSSSPEEDGMVKEDNSIDDNQSVEDENQLHTSFSRKRKGRLGSSDESSDSDIGAKEKRIRSSRATTLREKKEASKLEKLQELKRTRDRKQAGLRIEALEEKQQEEDNSTMNEVTDSEEGDEEFVVSDGEADDQPSDFEHSSDDLHLVLQSKMSTKLFAVDHINEVKGQLLKTLQRRKSIDCDKLLKAVEEGDIKQIDVIMKQLTTFYNNADLSSAVAHLTLQLTICYGHSSLVEPLLVQYKINSNKRDYRGIFPLSLAAAHGHYDCFKTLLHHTTSQSSLAQHPTLLHVVVEAALSNNDDASNDNCYHIMKILYEQRRKLFDQMMSSKTHPTVVEMAIWHGRVMCLTFLLGNYAEVFKDVEVTKNNSEGFPPSPIILTVCSPCQQEIGNHMILDLLLEHRIGNVDTSDSKGWTGLMWSTYYRNTDCMKSLLGHHATVYRPDEHGTSCLHIAALLGSTKCAQLLISHKHPVDCPDNKGWPPLLYANFSSERECVLAIMNAKPNQLFMLGKLLEKSCDVESEAKQRTYLQVQKVLEAVAQHEAYYAVFNQFIRANPDILTDEEGDSAFLQKCKDLLDFNNKKEWFYLMLENMKKFATYSDYRGDYYGYTTLRDISRESVLLTAYKKLRYTSASILRMNFSVTFLNEPGIAAGPRREFWSCFSQDVVKKDHHLFKKCDNSHYTFIPNDILKYEKLHMCFSKEDHLDLLKFIGKMLAVAVNHKDIISFRLAHPILKMLLGTSLVHPDDLETIDGEFYQNFQSFDGDISELELSFSDSLCCPVCGKLETFNLLTPNSNECDVTEMNKADFIKAMSIFKLKYSIKKETDSFLRGFWEVIPLEYLRIFTPDQFSLLLSGIPKIDVDDWERNTEYPSYGSSNENTANVIRWFWSLVRSLGEEEKALLLKFCTGSPRVPAGGFAHLEGISGLTKFRISFDAGEDRVPHASTCFNNLRLTHYTSEQQCRDKILIAIRFGCEGFSFS